MPPRYKGPAYLAVLDGDDPLEWTPWQRPVIDVCSCAQSVKTPDSDPVSTKFSVTLEVLTTKRAELLARQNWYGVIGAVVDLTAPDSDLRELHAKLCYSISSAASLSSDIGYYIVFVTSDPPTTEQLRLMTDFERDAAVALSLPPGVPLCTFEVSSFDLLAPVLRHFEKQMRRSPKTS